MGCPCSTRPPSRIRDLFGAVRAHAASAAIAGAYLPRNPAIMPTTTMGRPFNRRAIACLLPDLDAFKNVLLVGFERRKVIRGEHIVLQW